MYTLNKFALTDKSTTENHIIDWKVEKIIDKVPNRITRQIKEAIWIRKTNHQ